MRSSSLPLPFVLLCLVCACSGKVTTISSDEDDDPRDAAGGSSSGGSGSGGAPWGSGGSNPSGGSDATGGVTYMDPECPEEEPPPPMPECDPLDPYAACEDGEGCYPYLQYPAGEGCGFPTFGAACAPASTGEQGDFCGDDGQYCAPGFMCVVGAAGGKRCGKVCQTVKDHGCPEGLICGETDVQGFGVCF